jgi:phospholipid/cholesterol/gamma-HCH transport system substrate-binding protein
MEMGSLNATLRNIEQITSDLKVSGKDIRQFTHGQLPSIIAKIDTTIADLQGIVSNVKDANVQNTVENLNETIKVLNDLLQSEDGTLGLLLNDTELHDNLNTALKNLDKAVLNVDSVVMSIKEQPFIKKRMPKN